ncbi:MAG: hypothetical protein ACQEP8_02260 [Chlamydiota bacterium]
MRVEKGADPNWREEPSGSSQSISPADKKIHEVAVKGFKEKEASQSLKKVTFKVSSSSPDGFKGLKKPGAVKEKGLNLPVYRIKRPRRSLDTLSQKEGENKLQSLKGWIQGLHSKECNVGELEDIAAQLYYSLGDILLPIRLVGTTDLLFSAGTTGESFIRGSTIATELRDEIFAAHTLSEPSTASWLKTYELLALGLLDRGYIELGQQLLARCWKDLGFSTEHPLINFSAAVDDFCGRQPLPHLGGSLSGVGGGTIKRGMIEFHKRRQVPSFDADAEDYELGAQDIVRLSFKVNHPQLARWHKVIPKMLEDSESKSSLEALLPEGFCKGVEVRYIPYHVQKQIVNPANAESILFVDNANSEIVFGTALEVEFIGVGIFRISTSKELVGMYNRAELIMAEDVIFDRGLEKAHIILSALGFPTALAVSSQEDQQRMKLLTVLHAHYPEIGYFWERQLATYSLPFEKLKTLVLRRNSNVATELQRYLEGDIPLMEGKEIYQGRPTLYMADMGKRLRDVGGVGLMHAFHNDDALGFEEFRSHAAEFAANLRGGVAKISNQELFLKQGKTKGGSSPEEDLEAGGFDNVFTRLVTRSSLAKVKISDYSLVDEGIKMLFDLDVAGMQSTYGYTADHYGSRGGIPDFLREDDDSASPSDVYPKRLDLIQLVKSLENRDVEEGDNVYNEMMIRDAVGIEFLKGVIVDNQKMYDILVEELDKQDLIQKTFSADKPVSYITLGDRMIPLTEFIYVKGLMDYFTAEMWA